MPEFAAASSRDFNASAVPGASRANVLSKASGDSCMACTQGALDHAAHWTTTR
jgi:hypothetical protein